MRLVYASLWSLIASSFFVAVASAQLPRSGWVDDGPVVRLQTAQDKVGVGTTSPDAKLTVAGDIHTTTGGFIFANGALQERGAITSADYVIEKINTNYRAVNSAGIVGAQSSNAATVIQFALDTVPLNGSIVVRGDVDINSSLLIAKKLQLSILGMLRSQLPAGQAAIVIGDSSHLVSGAALNIFEAIDPTGSKTHDFIRFANAQFTTVNLGQANFFRYTIHVAPAGPPNSGVSVAQNSIRYAVIANCNKGYFHENNNGATFGEGNEMRGGAIFACNTGIHIAAGTDGGGMSITGVLDMGETGIDYVYDYVPPPGQSTIGNLLQLSFIRMDNCSFHPFDVLANAFGPQKIGTAIVLGENNAGNTPFLDFKCNGAPSNGFCARLISPSMNQLRVEANLTVTGGTYTDFLQNHDGPLYLNPFPPSQQVIVGGVGGTGDMWVTGNFFAQNKSFLIDHPLDPENKYLAHSSIESDGMRNLYTGRVTTDETGTAVVQLPNYFDALNTNVDYQLTVIGDFAQAIVSKEVQDNRFEIKTDKPSVQVSWQVVAERQDEYALQNPLTVEKDKPEKERGKRLIYPSSAKK